MNVLICDDLVEDDLEFEKAITAANQSHIKVRRLTGVNLKSQLGTLIEKADSILSENDHGNTIQETEFDKDIDLVILDNNLAHLRIQGARLTAESVAGYIRAFSSTPYIVSINKNPEVDFDLRYLIGDYTTRADLALNTHHLSNPALWTRDLKDAKREFLPWYWPKLSDVATRRRRQIEFVEVHLDDAVTATIGFTPDDYRALSRQARSLLSEAEDTRNAGFSPDALSGFSATFREVFLTSSRSLPNRDERKFLNAKCESGPDRQEFQRIMAKIIAADVDFWFRRDILGPQEVIVDLPHLVIRMPFLLGDNVANIESWRKVVMPDISGSPFGLDGAMVSTHLEDARVQSEIWGPCPCFFWSRLSDDDQLSSYFYENNVDWPEVVFCEDRSDYLPLKPAAESLRPREFVSQFEGSWNRRYVSRIEGVRYAPKTRFAK